MKTVRFGVIGTNFISDLFADGVGRVDGCEIAAVYSRREETGRAFAEKNGLAVPIYTDLSHFFAADIDAVYVASPNFCHKEQTLGALRAGKHVLVEKPAGITAAQFDEMQRAARERGLVLTEAMRPYFDPALGVIKAHLGDVGTVRHARFNFCQYSSRYDRFLAGEVPNAFNPALSNGAVMDIGVYCAALSCYLFGKPETVRASSVFLHNGMEGSGTAILSYGNFTAELCYSKIFQSALPNVIEGEKGTLRFASASVPHDIVLQERIGREHREIPLEAPTAENNMIYEIDAFCSFVRDGTGQEPYGMLTHMTMQTLDAIRKSAGVVFREDNE